MSVDKKHSTARCRGEGNYLSTSDAGGGAQAKAHSGYRQQRPTITINRARPPFAGSRAGVCSGGAHALCVFLEASLPEIPRLGGPLADRGVRTRDRLIERRPFLLRDLPQPTVERLQGTLTPNDRRVCTHHARIEILPQKKKLHPRS